MSPTPGSTLSPCPSSPLQYANDPVSVKSFMQCVFDPQDKLDEIAIVFAWNYYAILSAGAERLKDLAPLYSESSVRGKGGEGGREGGGVFYGGESDLPYLDGESGLPYLCPPAWPP